MNTIMQKRSRGTTTMILEGTLYCYLVVQNQKGQERIFAFDGRERCKVPIGESSEAFTVCELLREYIEQGNTFSFEKSGVVRCRKDGDIRLGEVLYSLYHLNDQNNGREVVGTQEEGEIKFFFNFCRQGSNTNRRKCLDFMGVNRTFENDTDWQEIEYIKSHNVGDYTKEVLNSVWGTSVTHSHGVIIPEGSGENRRIVVIYCPTKERGESRESLEKWSYYTDYNKDFLTFLQSLKGWRLGDSKRPLVINLIAFATVVWAWQEGWIFNTIEWKRTLESVNKLITQQGYEVDHLTGDKRNNFTQNLALLPRSINVSLGNRRTRIKAPYYFYTVHSKHNNKSVLLVECGIEGRYHKLLWFDLNREAEQYGACFDAFCKKARSEGYFLKAPSDECLLYRWAKPERHNEAGNPLDALVKEPISRFEKYGPDAFDDMPEVSEK